MNLLTNQPIISIAYKEPTNNQFSLFVKVSVRSSLLACSVGLKKVFVPVPVKVSVKVKVRVSVRVKVNNFSKIIQLIQFF